MKHNSLIAQLHQNMWLHSSQKKIIPKSLAMHQHEEHLGNYDDHMLVLQNFRLGMSAFSTKKNAQHIIFVRILNNMPLILQCHDPGLQLEGMSTIIIGNRIDHKRSKGETMWLRLMSNQNDFIIIKSVVTATMEI